MPTACKSQQGRGVLSPQRAMTCRVFYHNQCARAGRADRVQVAAGPRRLLPPGLARLLRAQPAPGRRPAAQGVPRCRSACRLVHRSQGAAPRLAGYAAARALAQDSLLEPIVSVPVDVPQHPAPGSAADNLHRCGACCQPCAGSVQGQSIGGECARATRLQHPLASSLAGWCPAL